MYLGLPTMIHQKKKKMVTPKPKSTENLQTKCINNTTVYQKLHFFSPKESQLFHTIREEMLIKLQTSVMGPINQSSLTTAKQQRGIAAEQLQRTLVLQLFLACP